MELQGNILTGSGFTPGTLRFGRLIEEVVPGPGGDLLVLPGFIDGHVHGGGGGDTMDGPAGVATSARFHARHGTTTMLPTTMTAPWPEVMGALRGVAEARAAGVPGGADILGAHLEGPFISPKRLGAQPPFALDPTPELVAQALALDVVRVVTMAPELPGALPAAVAFAAAGVRVSFGHTVGSDEDANQVAAAVRAAGGTVGGTHLYNAMSGLTGRSPGVIGALLADPAVFAELILDLHHVYKGAYLAARAALGNRLVLVTDAIRAAGLGDGESELGGQRVWVEGGRARLADGTLAGSVLTMDQAVRNAVACGVPLEAAARSASEGPASYLGLADRGRLEAGLRADLVVLGPDLEVRGVWVGGEAVP